MIICGFFCCFFGSILIAWAVALLLAVAASAATFLIVYNFIPYDVPRTVITLVLLGSVAAGLVVGYFGYKWSKSHSIYVPIIGGWGGLALATLLLQGVFHVENRIATLITAAAGAVLGGMVANQFKAKLKWIGTAVIGSYILMRGVALSVGRLPIGETGDSVLRKDQVAAAKADTAYALAYLAGGIGLAVLGALFQWKFFASKVEEDDDDYKKDGQDEGSKFWCFKK